jgi:hypothetical protein
MDLGYVCMYGVVTGGGTTRCGADPRAFHVLISKLIARSLVSINQY